LAHLFNGISKRYQNQSVWYNFDTICNQSLSNYSVSIIWTSLSICAVLFRIRVSGHKKIWSLKGHLHVYQKNSALSSVQSWRIWPGALIFCLKQE
jgi:hypothetical protein